jgi:tRNA pseudouridine13 synthase
MVKRNWDTLQAVRAVAQQLGINPSQIHIAGLKDAKAVTAQHVTLEGILAEDIQAVNVKGLELHPIGYVRNRLSSYYLLGNSFNITIKAINHSESTIEKRITKTIQELDDMGGVPNFFGHQRFGTTRPITHLVGKALFKGNLKEAAMLFLAKSSPYEHPESRRAREELTAKQDFKRAAKSFPKQLRYERAMLKHLANRPNDFTGAFRRLPLKLQELFPQAYQSYLFNKFLGGRIASGLPLNRAEVGDYVVHVERSGLPMQAMSKIATIEKLAEINKAIQAGKMRLALPLVGIRQRTSQGVQGEIERQILEEEGTASEDFETMLETAVKGELRTAITPLNNFSLEEISHDSANPSKCRINITFTLYRGSYATITLRELMKTRNPIKAGF